MKIQIKKEVIIILFMVLVITCVGFIFSTKTQKAQADVDGSSPLVLQEALYLNLNTFCGRVSFQIPDTPLDLLPVLAPGFSGSLYFDSKDYCFALVRVDEYSDYENFNTDLGFLVFDFRLFSLLESKINLTSGEFIKFYCHEENLLSSFGRSSSYIESYSFNRVTGFYFLDFELPTDYAKSYYYFVVGGFILDFPASNSPALFYSSSLSHFINRNVFRVDIGGEKSNCFSRSVKQVASAYMNNVDIEEYDPGFIDFLEKTSTSEDFLVDGSFEPILPGPDIPSEPGSSDSPSEPVIPDYPEQPPNKENPKPKDADNSFFKVLTILLGFLVFFVFFYSCYKLFFKE